MGIPGEKFDSLYRNHINDVANYLNYRHSTNYMIYNLSEKKYDYIKFNDQVKEYGWPDHHAPPLQLLWDLVEDMYNWLSSSSSHVAVVHCKAGRGRTGTAIACLLYKLKVSPSATEALHFFARQRSRTGEGVAVPSQKRSLHYFIYANNNGYPPKKTIKLTKVELEPIPSIDLRYPIRIELCNPLSLRPYHVCYNTNSMYFFPFYLNFFFQFFLPYIFVFFFADLTALVWNVTSSLKKMLVFVLFT